MVKVVVESGVGATAISKLMIIKELRLDTLRSIKVTDGMKDATDTDPLPLKRSF